MNDNQMKVAEIFKEVLECGSVSLDDEFLQLGGDSMSAMLCISRIRAQFKVELSVEDFFTDVTTIRSISLLIDELNAKPAS
jgi:yersiniabactin nonribosomal peptide synthetase